MTSHIEAIARAMCKATGIDPEAGSLGKDGKMRRAWEARIKEATLAFSMTVEVCAEVAAWAHMVPPDGGSPSKEECDVATEAASRIRALVNEKEVVGHTEIKIGDVVTCEYRTGVNTVIGLPDAHGAWFLRDIEGTKFRCLPAFLSRKV